MVLVSLFGQPIVRSISHFYGQPKKIVQFQRQDNFFVQSFLKIGYPLIRNWTKNQESQQKKCPVSKTGQFVYWADKKNEKLTEQLVCQETDQNHMELSN